MRTAIMDMTHTLRHTWRALSAWRVRWHLRWRVRWRVRWWRVRSPAARRYGELANAWRAAQATGAAGTPARGVHETAATHWWLAECDQRGERVSAAIRAWHTAGDAALARENSAWLEGYLRIRVQCECGQRWRVESTAFCTHCNAVLAACCVERATLPRWRNGNAVCPRCEAGEVVG